jgi:hypothetical protein
MHDILTELPALVKEIVRGTFGIDVKATALGVASRRGSGRPPQRLHVMAFIWSPMDATLVRLPEPCWRHVCPRKQSRSSRAKGAGCSKAAKWPPLSSSFQWMMFG